VERRVVTLRSERDGPMMRYLGASVDETGALKIKGQDLGPGTEMVSSDGEYEWFETIAAGDVPRVIALLSGEPGTDVLDLLEQHWTGTQSYELERRLRESDIPRNISTWSG
jgi:hypothetical protein